MTPHAENGLGASRKRKWKQVGLGGETVATSVGVYGPLARWTSPPSTSPVASVVIADARPSVHPSKGRRSPNQGNGDVQKGAMSEWQDAPRMRTPTQSIRVDGRHRATWDRELRSRTRAMGFPVASPNPRQMKSVIAGVGRFHGCAPLSAVVCRSIQGDPPDPSGRLGSALFFHG